MRALPGPIPRAAGGAAGGQRAQRLPAGEAVRLDEITDGSLLIFSHEVLH